MKLTVLEPSWTGRTWLCQVQDDETGAIVAETYGASLLEAECKAIGAAEFGNSVAAREAETVAVIEAMLSGGQGRCS